MYALFGNGIDEWEICFLSGGGRVAQVELFTAKEEIRIFWAYQKKKGVEEPRILTRNEAYINAKKRATREFERIQTLNK